MEKEFTLMAITANGAKVVYLPPYSPDIRAVGSFLHKLFDTKISFYSVLCA